MQDLIRRHDGVISTRVGYTGGDVPNATYRNHGTHAEAIEIVFDPAKISYRRLLEFFFQIHDPTTRNRQGNDIGTSYRSAIFYTSEEQKCVAEDTIADVDASGLWPGKAPSRRHGYRAPAGRSGNVGMLHGGARPANQRRKAVVTRAQRSSFGRTLDKGSSPLQGLDFEPSPGAGYWGCSKSTRSSRDIGVKVLGQSPSSQQPRSSPPTWRCAGNAAATRTSAANVSRGLSSTNGR
jgi:methionine-S-sulfoxide reductase